MSPPSSVAGARPAILWIFAAGLAYNVILHPLLQWTVTFLAVGAGIEWAPLANLPARFDYEELWPIIGGIFGLVLFGIPFSVSAAIGFIALFGISVMDGIIIISQYNALIRAGMERSAAVIKTGELQMRPVLMTCVIAAVGLLPAAMSTSIGSQVQKPLAIVVVCGMLMAPVVILITLPVLVSLFGDRGAEPKSTDPQPDDAEVVPTGA